MSKITSKVKVCSRCKVEKPVSEFGQYRAKLKKKTVLRHWAACKECRREHDRKRGRESKKWFVEKYGCTCVKCRISKHYLIEPHHLDPSKKEFSILQMIFTTDAQKKRCEEEMKKCILLCVQCHREYHTMNRVANAAGFLLDTYTYLDMTEQDVDAFFEKYW